MQRQRTDRGRASGSGSARRAIAPVLVAALAVTALASPPAVTGAQAPPRGGSVDTSFGTNGVARITLAAGPLAVEDVVVDDAGGVFLVGSSGATDDDPHVTRLTATGRLDRSWSGDGHATIGLGPVSDLDAFATAAELQPDGRLVVAGYIIGDTTTTAFVTRMDADGTVDDGFGTAGLAPLGDSASRVIPAAVTVLPDGRIVVVGQRGDPGDVRGWTVGLTRSGRLDNGFGTAGLIEDDGPMGVDVRLVDVEPRGDGLVSAALLRTDGFPASSVFARLSDGDRDDDFVVLPDFGSELRNTFAVESIDVDADERVLAMGALEVGPDPRSGAATPRQAGTRRGFLFRVEPDGASPLNVGGFGEEFEAGDVDALADGRIVVTGTVDEGGALAAYRFLPDGELDPDFGDLGEARVATNVDAFVVGGGGVTADGHVIVAGTFEDGLTTGILVTHFEPGPPPAMCDGRMVTVSLERGDPVTDGDDVILGTARADVIDAIAGDDVICGLGGADTIAGGAGDDTILGGRGADTLGGGRGADVLDGGPGRDRLDGGPGRADRCTPSRRDTLRRCEGTP